MRIGKRRSTAQGRFRKLGDVSEDSVMTEQPMSLLLPSPRSWGTPAPNSRSQKKSDEGVWISTPCSNEVLKLQVTACQGVLLHICTLRRTLSKEVMQFVHVGMSRTRTLFGEAAAAVVSRGWRKSHRSCLRLAGPWPPTTLPNSSCLH